MNFETNYIIDGRDVLLEVNFEYTYKLGEDGYPEAHEMIVKAAHAFDDDGKEITLTNDQLSAIKNDAVLEERATDYFADQAMAHAERHR